MARKAHGESGGGEASARGRTDGSEPTGSEGRQAKRSNQSRPS